MKTPGEVLGFAVANEGADVETLEVALRSLGRLAAQGGTTGQGHDWIVSDGRFNVLLNALTSRLETCDSRRLALAADAAARFRAPTPELRAVLERAAEAAVVRENSFSPRSLTTLALALAARGVRGAPPVHTGVQTLERGPGDVVLFVRGEAMRQLQEFEPACCMALLEAFRRWGIRDPELTEMALERLSDATDELRTKDLVEILATFSKLGVTRGGLLRKLCKLAFQQLRQFSARQLVALLYALARLRFLSGRDVDDILQALLPDLGRLSDRHISQVLFALAMVDSASSPELARVLLVQYDEGADDRDLLADVDFVWAICALGLADAYPRAHGRALGRVFRQSPLQNYLPLLKIFDVFCLSEACGADLRGQAVPAWRAACARAAAAEAGRRASSKLCLEVGEHLGALRRWAAAAQGPGAGPALPSRVQRGAMAGPCYVDLLDEASHLVVELEPVGWPVSRRLAHRALRRHGYRTLRVEQWDWQDTRSDADRRAFLLRGVRRAHLERTEA